MAITAATTLAGFSGFLTREMSEPIFDQVRRVSAVQQLARQVPLGGNGRAIPVTTGKLSAAWVAEGAQKPAFSSTRALKTMDPKKIATIAVVSEEVVRANPGGFMQDIRLEAAEAFAVAFDSAAFHGTASPFTTNIAQTTKSVEFGTATAAAGGIYADLNSGLTLLVNDNKKLTGFAFDNRAEPLFNGAVDTTGRAIFVNTPPADGSNLVLSGRLLGRPTFIGDGVFGTTGTILGFGGDWTQCAWGVVGGINYSVSNQATVTINGALVSLFENNLVAVRMEAEYGWLVNDVGAFVKYANAT